MMSTPNEHEIWRRVTEIVTADRDVGPATAGQLGLAVPRGIAAHTLYLAVPHKLTLEMIEKRLRPAIMRALEQLPEAADIETFVVMVDPEAEAELEERHATSPEVSAHPSVHSADIPSVKPAATPHTVSDASATAAADQPLDAQTADTPGSTTETTGSKTAKKSTPNPQNGKDHSATGRTNKTPPADSANSRLNEKYSFDSFVVGQSNRFAHAAAFAVGEAPARAYNPLFIYGDSGLGKTHLLHAIGHYALQLYPNIRVRYVSSEEFTNDFINSIANNQGTEFHERYRNIDILLVDDIQFLGGKAETQEAFFHTFNTLQNHEKQIVITSDVAPKQLRGFEDRMLSRFDGALLTDVQAPNLETRIAILRKKAQSEGLTVDEEILQFIASKFTSNIRELEGTLIRVTAFANLNKQPIDMALVHTVLKDLISLDDDSDIQPGDIINQISDYFRISVDELHGPGRSQQVALARQIAMYLCRELTQLSLPKIGQLFGGRDHTTVMYAHKKITQLVSENRSIYNQVQELTSRIKQGR